MLFARSVTPEPENYEFDVPTHIRYRRNWVVTLRRRNSYYTLTFPTGQSPQFSAALREARVSSYLTRTGGIPRDLAEKRPLLGNKRVDETIRVE